MYNILKKLGSAFLISVLLVSCMSDKDFPEENKYEESFVKVGLSDATKFTKFHASMNLSVTAPEITTLALVVHGLSYDYQEQLSFVYKSLDEIGKSAQTLVVSPLFANETTEADISVWSGAVWKTGEKSTDGQSSYLLLEAFLKDYIFTSTYPNLKQVILIGHSAGGQFMQRYAALNNLEQAFPNIEFQYAVANPSSYLYINEERFSDKHNAYVVPTTKDYNVYPYGLADISNFKDYRSDLTVVEIQATSPERNVTYFGGTLDLSNQDGSAAANWQGGGEDITDPTINTRYKRSQYMFKFYEKFFPSNKHQHISVEGVDHSAGGVILSPEFQNWLTTVIK